MRQHRPLLVSFALFIATAPAAAQQTAGRVRLSLDGTLFDYRALSSAVTVTDPAGSGATAQAELASSNTTVALLDGGFGAGVAYGAGKHTVVGLRALVANRRAQTGDLGEAQSTSVSTVPYLAVLPGAEGPLRPFVGVEAGYQSEVQRVDGAVSSRTAGGLVGASAGLIGFAAPGFSIDAGLGAYAFAGRIVQGPYVEGSTSGAAVIARVSFSGWLGRDRPGAASVPADGPAAIAAPASAQAATLAPLRVDRGLIVVTVPLDPSAELALVATPLSAPNAVLARLVVRDDGGELASCEELLLDDGAALRAATDVRHETHDGGFYAAEHLVGTFHLGAVASLTTTASPASLRACGREWPVQGAQRRELARVAHTVALVRDGKLLAAAHPVVEDRGDTLDTRVTLGPEHSLALSGQPEVAGSPIQVALLAHQRSAPQDACTRLEFNAGGERVAVGTLAKDEVDPSFPSAGVRGSIPVQSLVALVESRGALEVRACGRSTALPVAAQQVLWHYLQVFAHRAIRAGTWDAQGKASEAGEAEAPGSAPR